MKKYLQIVSVLTVFFTLVLFQHLSAHPAVALQQVAFTPTPSAKSTSTPPGSSSATSNATAPPPPQASSTPQTSQSQSTYRDGTYIGDVAYAYYGYVQVKVTIANGKLTDVQFLQYPNHAFTSQRINSVAMPWLKQEAIQAQSANVDIISGASATSLGFHESLATALQKAG